MGQILFSDFIAQILQTSVHHRPCFVHPNQTLHTTLSNIETNGRAQSFAFITHDVCCVCS
jgi:hypothetical protein